MLPPDRQYIARRAGALDLRARERAVELKDFNAARHIQREEIAAPCMVEYYGCV
jgi:hypothetical protein